jgi:hypothetical protein
VLALDEVKSYGRAEVVYLEQWKKDGAFLQWMFETYGAAEVADKPEPAASQPGEPSLQEAWTANMQKSVNEPQLILYAQQYCELDAGRRALMEGILSRIGHDNSVESFWHLLKWIKTVQTRRVLVVFRTFGTDLDTIMER